MPTVGEVLKENRAIFGTVPHSRNGFVCAICLGPVDNYAQCYSCHQVFNINGAPASLRDRIVPMSSAVMPGPWYTRLSTYKRGQPEYMKVLASLSYLYIMEHQERINGLLGGELDLVAVVPSKRGVAFADQPLRKILVGDVGKKVRNVVAFRSGARVGRRDYSPEAFSVSTDVEEKRVLLIDDSWVTGATAVSCAGAMLESGAEEVVIMPIARVVESPGFWPNDHPYVTAMRESYDLRHWPL